MNETLLTWSPPNIVSIALMLFIILTLIGFIAKMTIGRKKADG